jgi:beta-lactamase regulating signal transducer with metallopeptidase domain
VNAATWVLLTLLKATALLLAVFLAATLLRRASASLRHLVWSGGIAAVLVLPLVSLVVPWHLGVVPAPVAAATALRLPAAVAPPAPGQASSALPPASATAPGGETAPAPTGSGLRAPWTGLSLAAWLLVVWALGVLAVLLRLARGAVLVRRVLRGAVVLESPDWRRPLMEVADRLGLGREPRLLSSDRVQMPVVCGVRDPTVVLPAGARDWSERRRRAVLCHELAHVRRFDLAVTMLGRLGCALYWFHPLFWAAARRLRAESERACDDLVLGVGTRASEYADHLLEIACDAGRQRTPALAIPMAERREFEGRMLAILEKDAARAPTSPRRAALVGTLGLAALLPLAAMGAARARSDAVPRSRAQHDSASANPTGGIDPAGTHAETAAMARHVERMARTDAEKPQVDQPAAASRAARPPHPAASTPTAAPSDTGDAATVHALLGALDDSVASVRHDAAYALGRLEAAGAVAELGAHLRREPAADVREMEAWALGRIESREGTPPLVAVAQHDASEKVRAMAVWALGRIEDSSALPGLAAALRDASAEVRGRAAWAIGSIGAHRAPPALISLLGDRSAEVRVRAAWALGRIGDAAAAPRLAALLADSASEVRHAGIWALGQMEAPEAHQALLGALKNPDPDVRARAARALAGSGGDPWPWPWPMPIN